MLVIICGENDDAFDLDFILNTSWISLISESIPQNRLLGAKQYVTFSITYLFCSMQKSCSDF